MSTNFDAPAQPLPESFGLAKPVVPRPLVWGTRPSCAARVMHSGAGIGMGRRCGEFDGPGARSSGSGVDWIYGNAGLALVAALLCHLANSGTKRNRCIPCHGKAQIG